MNIQVQCETSTRLENGTHLSRHPPGHPHGHPSADPREHPISALGGRLLAMADTPHEHPPQRLTLEQAATLAERSRSTLRRWLRDGRLTRHEAKGPNHGGSPAVLIDRAELVAHLLTSGATPRPSTDEDPPGAQTPVQTPGGSGVQIPPVDTRGAPADTTLGEAAPVALELARLRGRLALAEQAGELREVRARLEAALSEVGALERQLSAAGAAAEDLRRERDDWRDRHDAREAEISALRQLQGLPWWRRLLAAPSAASAPEDEP